VSTSPTADATSKQLGYRLPAEWEPHEATWLSWPHKEASWPGKIDTIFPVYAQMVAALARSETVHINVNDAAMEAKARRFLDGAQAAGDIRFHHYPTNDAWCHHSHPSRRSRVQSGATGDRLGLQRLGQQVPAARFR
jgi:agmatine deiminase